MAAAAIVAGLVAADAGVASDVLGEAGEPRVHIHILRRTGRRGHGSVEYVGNSGSSVFEGAVNEDGRGQTIWDTFAHTPGKIPDASNADVAVDQYHRFKDDIELMADMGMDAYRFSIAWSRIFPNGIEPYVTLYHWDLPQALEDRYNGWLDRQIVDDFTEYAETCFKAFGDRVKHWVTLNEPHTVATVGYGTGLEAPGRCSVLLHLPCESGNSGTEPYIVGHNFILAHATVADIYRKKYKATQNGQLGIAFDVVWYEPMTNTTADIEAAKRAQEFQLGWFADPFFFGDYPAVMRARVGDRLPKFTADESTLVKGALHFVGINHYTTHYSTNNNSTVGSAAMGLLLEGTMADTGTVSVPFDIKNPTRDRANSLWLSIVPWGMRKVMKYVKDRYNNPQIYITENGMDDSNNPLISREEALRDKKRIKYHHDYLTNLAASIMEDGCDVCGYFVWSLLDNWEWTAGYTSRFGLYFVDYTDNLKRYPKDSVEWFRTLLRSR